MYHIDWPYAFGAPKSAALFKVTPQDFKVTELFTEPFSGVGEHIILKIEKIGLNTEEVARSLGRLIKKSPKLISYAGLKDKQALTIQYFSIHAPGEEINNLDQLAAPGWRVLEHTRHSKKLKPGFLAGNHFNIQLQDITEPEELTRRLEIIKQNGVPNYFGEQRFGIQLQNLNRAEELLVHKVKVKDKFIKGIYYSAARSWLFNLILAKRVQERTWNSVLAGDVLQLSGTNSIFVAEETDDLLLQRIKEKDISPASPLPGRSKNKVKNEAQVLINQVYSQWQAWVEGLEQQGLEEAWRANILHVAELEWTFEENSLLLSFSLPPGTYATAVLRELASYSIAK